MSGDAVTLLTDRDHENFRRVLSDRSIQIHKTVPPHFETVRFQRFQENRQGHHGSSFRVGKGEPRERSSFRTG